MLPVIKSCVRTSTLLAICGFLCIFIDVVKSSSTVSSRSSSASFFDPSPINAHHDSNCTVPADVFGPLPSSQMAALKLSMSETGLQRYTNEVFDWVENFLYELVLPDIVSSVDLGIANISYSLADFDMLSFSIESVSVSLQEATAVIAFAISDSSTDLTFNWGYSEDTWPYIGDDGYGEATVTDCSGNGEVSILLNTDLCPGTPIADLLSFDFNVGNIDITLHGGASWLYDLIIDVFIDIITQAFQDELSEAMGMAIEETVNGNLPSLDYTFSTDVGEDTYLDQRWLTAPKVGDHFISVSHHMMVSDLDTSEGVEPFTEVPMEMPDILDDFDIQMFLSSCAVNSMHHVFFNNGFYSGVIDPASKEFSTTHEFAALLTTDVLSQFIPNLIDYQGHSVVLSIEATARPNATVMPVALLVDNPTVLTARMDSPQGSILFDLNWDLQTSADVEMWTNISVKDGGYNATYFYLDHSAYSQSVSIKSSNIGSFEITQDIEQLMMLLASEVVCPWLTENQKHTLRLPASNFIDSNYEVIYHPPGYVFIHTGVIPDKA
eukprot:gnl/Dysnectes_brevis/2447_a2916_1444.p1 GENE.gnl/Dysnectes_brevis/2447_a2916_1444~~gnl/Dysnectes_brevis/2447_a2916_1444.p1  ORF type:complete len:550 (-),score=92.61 gnl/Dysnectes_brevis/2447_a2916_1444:82-1731(-)